jgi:hypothetical protein
LQDEGQELERRIEKMAAQDDGIFFLSLADHVPYGDRSYFGADMIHLSLKVSAEIGAQVAEIITKVQNDCQGMDSIQPTSDCEEMNCSGSDLI